MIAVQTLALFSASVALLSIHVVDGKQSRSSQDLHSRVPKLKVCCFAEEISLRQLAITYLHSLVAFVMIILKYSMIWVCITLH
jgi:hypothetical protein